MGRVWLSFLVIFICLFIAHHFLFELTGYGKTSSFIFFQVHKYLVRYSSLLPSLRYTRRSLSVLSSLSHNNSSFPSSLTIAPLVRCTADALELSLHETFLGKQIPDKTAQRLKQRWLWPRETTETRDPAQCRGLLQPVVSETEREAVFGRFWTGRINLKSCLGTELSYIDHLTRDRVIVYTGYFDTGTFGRPSPVAAGCICRQKLQLDKTTGQREQSLSANFTTQNVNKFAVCKGIFVPDGLLPDRTTLEAKKNVGAGSPFHDLTRFLFENKNASASILSVDFKTTAFSSLNSRWNDTTRKHSTSLKGARVLPAIEPHGVSADVTAPPASVHVTFQSQIRTVDSYRFGYPNFCFLTRHTSDSDQQNLTSMYTHFIRGPGVSAKDELMDRNDREYIVQDGCPTSERWDFRVLNVSAVPVEEGSFTTVTMSFSLEGLRGSSLFDRSDNQFPKLMIRCKMDLYDDSIAEPAYFKQLCPTTKPLSSNRKLDRSARSNKLGEGGAKQSKSSISKKQEEEDSQLVMQLMSVPQQDVDRATALDNVPSIDQVLRRVKERAAAARPLTLTKAELKVYPDVADDFAYTSSLDHSVTPSTFCDPDFVKIELAPAAPGQQRSSRRQILQCRRQENYLSAYLQFLSTVEALETERLREKQPLTSSDLYESAEALLGETPTHNTGNVNYSLHRSNRFAKTRFKRGSAASAQERYSARYTRRLLMDTVDELQQRSLRTHQNTFPPNDLETDQDAAASVTTTMAAEFNTSSRHHTIHTPFRLRNYFLIPDVGREADAFSDPEEPESAQTEKPSFSTTNLIQDVSTTSSNITSTLETRSSATGAQATTSSSLMDSQDSSTADGLPDSSTNEQKQEKEPEFMSIVSAVDPDEAELGQRTEPVNRGIFGIGRYVPLSQTSMYQAINQVSYGPWFAKWGRNKPEKSSQVVVASDFGFLDNAVSGTQKELSFGGGWKNMMGAFSYNEIRQELALSGAVGNYGIKVDRSQTYNATAVEIFARGFQSGTLLNFVDRNFGQRFRIRNFEISLQHDFDDYFYPADPGFGTEFMVQYRGANLVLANDISERKIGVSVGLRGCNVAVLHDFDQYLTEVQANAGRGWQLAFGWDFPDMYSSATFVEAGFGRLNRVFAQAGAGVGDDGVPQASARLQTRNIGVDLDFLNEFGQRIFQYAVTVGRFSYVWQASVDLSAIRVPQFMGIKPMDVEKLLLSFLPDRS